MPIPSPCRKRTGRVDSGPSRSGVHPSGIRTRYLGRPRGQPAKKELVRRSDGPNILLDNLLEPMSRGVPDDEPLEAKHKDVEYERAGPHAHGVERETDGLDVRVPPRREEACRASFDHVDAVLREAELVAVDNEAFVVLVRGAIDVRSGAAGFLPLAALGDELFIRLAWGLVVE